MRTALAFTAARTPRIIPKARAAFWASLAIFTASVLTVDCAHGAEEEPASIVTDDVVEFSKLLPSLPDARTDWTADKPDGSTTDAGETKVTTVHRDYSKGEGDNVPTTSISILDSAANPEYVAATTAAWGKNASSAEGYGKSVTIEGNPGFEIYEQEGKHGTLWLLIAKRYFLQIETRGQDAAALQEWLKRIDLKKLAAVK